MGFSTCGYFCTSTFNQEFQANIKSDAVQMPTQKSIFMCIYKEYRYPKLAENKDVRQRNSNLTALHPDSFLSDRGKKATLKIFD
ncbi:hypothetical protein Gotri_015034 [Gossypium trilobum]|uniref:Uncharacterized protein n=1 Tax=Gossypium trilobum TaxID=34281 RepID=A0A7J9DYT0_9ROSI|nr:hypothetical protein [Gossypium trilobum]